MNELFKYSYVDWFYTIFHLYEYYVTYLIQVLSQIKVYFQGH
jgi:hypothetical protein